MIGYVQFAVLISIETASYNSMCERIFLEFQNNILYRPSIIDSDDRLIFVLYGENVYKVDSTLSRIDSFGGVKEVDVYIMTKWQHQFDWVINEIDKSLSGLYKHKVKLIGM
jgi:hypothetical protein